MAWNDIFLHSSPPYHLKLALEKLMPTMSKTWIIHSLPAFLLQHNCDSILNSLQFFHLTERISCPIYWKEYSEHFASSWKWMNWGKDRAKHFPLSLPIYGKQEAKERKGGTPLAWAASALPVWGKMLWAFRVRKPLSMGSFLTERIFRWTPNRVLMAWKKAAISKEITGTNT